MADNGRAAFGSWFQREREKAGVSQAAVAKKAGIHVIQLSRIENGHSGAKAPTIVLLVDAINELSCGYKVNKNEVLHRAGFAADEGLPLDVADDIRVSLLHGKDYTDEERAEFTVGLAAAYEALKARIEERKRRGD